MLLYSYHSMNNQKTASGGRIVYIDYLKSFAIFTVILGHSIQQVSGSSHLSYVYDVIYSFHMPLFMTISGLFLGSVMSGGLREVLLGKARSLLLPVVSFSVVVFALRLFTPVDLTDGLTFFGYLFGGDMWFLKYLFACICLAFVFKSLFRSDAVAALLPASVLVFVSRVGLFRLLPCLWLGYFLRKYESLWVGRRRVVCLSFIVFLMLLPFWVLEYDYPLYRILTLKDGLSLSFPALAVVLYRFAIGAAGSVFFISLFSVCFSHAAADGLFSRFVRTWGRRTLGIYCLQIYLLEDVFGRIHIPYTGEWLDTALVLAVAVAEFVLCGFLVGLLERNRYTAFLFLGRRIK